MTSEDSSPVLHVIVVGFHHKKGCQVEYSYPPLMAPDADPHSSELPSQWKQLPSLALPDGSHNFQEDTAFFHLPALDNPRKTVFGISCYRQIDAESLVNKTADITRGSVQKSVCVLSRLPLYGQIQVKMSLITEAYFREGDFTRLDLIHQTYDNLNSCLSDDMLRTQQLYVGLSARKFVQQFRQKSLVLFKLMLLERKVLFFQSPVNDLCGFFLTLLSLHPGMLEKGLDEAARMVPVDTPPSLSPCDQERPEAFLENESDEELKKEEDIEVAHEARQSEERDINDERKESECSEAKENNKEKEEDPERPDSVISTSSIVDIASEKVTGIKGKLSGAFGYITGFKSSDSLSAQLQEAKQEDDMKNSNSLDAISEVDAEEANIPVPNFQAVAATSSEAFGLPLNIFTGGNLCHPYLSLSYLDILTQPSIHGYLIGATNILFKQKKGIAEVVIDIEKDKSDILDPELRKALHLTTEDLRFIDNVVKHVSEESSDIFLDGVGWEGGDEWVRAQFRFYLACLLRTSFLKDDEKDNRPALFNTTFMEMWYKTKNYKCWQSHMSSSKEARETIDELVPGHPFAGQISMSDMKLHLSNTISNTEGGKKVTQVVQNTSKAVAGSLNSAKGAFSSFITSFRQPSVSPRAASPVQNEDEPQAAEEAKEG